MLIKSYIAKHNPVFANGDSFTKIKGIIITYAQIDSVTSYIDSINKWKLFAKCPHYFVDDYGYVVQALPENYMGKYCGKKADKDYLQIVFSCYNEKRPEHSIENSYLSLLDLCTVLCSKYKIDPSVPGNVITQNEGYKMGLCNNDDSLERVLLEHDMGYSIKRLREEITRNLKTGKGYYHENIDYSYVFDPEYYERIYPELKEEFGNNKRELFNHFLKFGMRECRKGSRDFDVVVYKGNNPDLDFGDNWAEYYKHYCTTGRFEKRKCV